MMQFNSFPLKMANWTQDWGGTCKLGRCLSRNHTANFISESMGKTFTFSSETKVYYYV